MNRRHTLAELDALLTESERISAELTRATDLEEIRSLAMRMLRVTWELDPDPDRQPWPGGEEPS